MDKRVFVNTFYRLVFRPFANPARPDEPLARFPTEFACFLAGEEVIPAHSLMKG